MSDFSDWLAEELNDKGWKKIELVKRSGLSQSYTYEIINGNVIPGVAACLAISRALNVSVETVVNQLGVPEKKSEFTEWVEDQLYKKGLKKSELINSSGLESTYANNIIGGNLKPTITACRAIARALDVSDETVLKHFGYQAHRSLPYNASEFTEWITEQLNNKGLKKHEFAKLSGLDKSYVYQIILGNKRPGAEACRGIARGLDVPEVTVFRQIGYLTEDPLLDPSTEEFISILCQLSEEDQSELLEIAKLKLDRQNLLQGIYS